MRKLKPLVRYFLNPSDPAGFSPGLAKFTGEPLPWGFGIPTLESSRNSYLSNTHGYIVKMPSMFLTEHYLGIPFAEWKEKIGDPATVNQRGEEAVEEMEKGFAMMYSHFTSLFDINTDYNLHHNFVSKPLANALNKQLGEWKLSGRDPRMDVKDVTAKIQHLIITPYQIDKNWYGFTWFGEAMMMKFYTVGCFRDYAMPMKIDFHIKIKSTEICKETQTEEIKEHIMVVGYLMNSFMCKSFSKDHEYNSPIIFNLNYAVDSMPIRISSTEEQIKMPQDLLELWKALKG